MMNFLIMTISIALGVLLAIVMMMVLVFGLMTSTKFMGWYMNKITKMSMKAFEEIDSQVEDL